MNSFLNTAIRIATEAHAGQVDKAGAPYIGHPRYVAEQLDSEDEKTVAYLHDVLEDTSVTGEDLARHFPPHILDAVIALTRNEHESYDEFIARVKQNPLARRVKLADLQHNMMLERIVQPTEADLQRLEKYRRSYGQLVECQSMEEWGVDWFCDAE